MRNALIVTSDSALRLALIRLFGRHGWCVDAPAYDDRALAFLAEDPRILTLLDWQTTYVCAPTFLAAIRRDPIWHAARVMAICCGSRPEEAERAVALGANDILEKPFRLEEIMDKMESLRPTTLQSREEFMQHCKQPDG
jgi:DNA-binding response OmpR family regulator